MSMKFFVFAAFIFLNFFTKKNSPPEWIPPGTVQINDTLFADRTEVANIHWREWLYFLLKVSKDTIAYLNALPDTMSWQKINWEQDSVNMSTVNAASEYYFRHPGFNNYPVVGISYEQAVEFCHWRSYMVNLGLYLKEKKIKNPRVDYNYDFPVKIIYRLPTRKEWEIIATGEFPNEFPYGFKDVFATWKKKKMKRFNCLYEASDSSFKNTDRAFYTNDIESYFPNSSGCYNMIGNISEMVSEKGIAKGGSFIHPLESCKISMDQYYTKPEFWLGFRCVAVLVK